MPVKNTVNLSIYVCCFITINFELQFKKNCMIFLRFKKKCFANLTNKFNKKEKGIIFFVIFKNEI
jgi:hypothetical protein